MHWLTPLIIFTHISDPTTSRSSEYAQDFLGAGVTMTFRTVEVDAALGRKATNCAKRDCPTEYGGMLSVKWHPFRKR